VQQDYLELLSLRQLLELRSMWTFISVTNYLLSGRWNVHKYMLELVMAPATMRSPVQANTARRAVPGASGWCCPEWQACDGGVCVAGRWSPPGSTRGPHEICRRPCRFRRTKIRTAVLLRSPNSQNVWWNARCADACVSVNAHQGEWQACRQMLAGN